MFKASETKPYGVEVSFRDITQEIESQSFAPPPELPEITLKKHLKVMLVEDCPEDRELYRRSLCKVRERHYTFIEAESGEQALELAQQQQPDLVLLDYLLPDMDGLEWLALWQEQEQENHPPVVVLTGQGDETVAVEFIKQGAADYLVKGQLTPDKLRLEVQ
ncbi:MAG: response regulator [Cyanobacteria bacterium P01_G01_bin.19]